MALSKEGSRLLRIAVALCSYQGERYIADQFASIAAQTRLPDQLVISDDGSTDATLAISDSFAASAAFPVTIIRGEDRVGVTRNFERAIGQCNADIIVLADQDDIWMSNRIAVLEEVFEQFPESALAFSNAELIDEQGRPSGNLLWTILGFGPRQQSRLRQDPFGQLMGRSLVSGCTLALRASCLDILIPFPMEQTSSAMRVLHDRWISLALSPAFGVSVINEPLVSYRLHPSQQIGIPSLQIRKLVPSAALRWRSAAVPTYEHTARLNATTALLQLVAQRLGQHTTGERRRLALEQLDEAIAHLQNRAAIGRSRAGRIPRVWREARTGRYHRFSLRFASVTADLVRPNRRAGGLGDALHPHRALTHHHE